MPRRKVHSEKNTDLTDREREILRLVIQQYVLTAHPVGSRSISRFSSIGLSDATLRNVMSDLEFYGYIDHPHTSAGRMPTDKGYRMYVDTLMKYQAPTTSERKAVERRLAESVTPDDVVKDAASILAKLSSQLSLLVLPALSEGVLERVEIVKVSANRVLIIIAVSSGRIRTVTLETNSELQPARLDQLSAVLNERLAGRTLAEVRAVFSASIHDLPEEDRSILRVFVQSPDKLFSDTGVDRVKMSGAKNIFQQPEFTRKQNIADDDVQSIIELIENEEVIIHLLERSGMIGDEALQRDENITIKIGSELEDKRMLNYSVISTRYQIGEQCGTIAVIGPKRMDYGRIAPLVGFVARAMSAAPHL
jgi:heat-inducible transcriptional repressor